MNTPQNLLMSSCIPAFRILLVMPFDVYPSSQQLNASRTSGSQQAYFIHIDFKASPSRSYSPVYLSLSRLHTFTGEYFASGLNFTSCAAFQPLSLLCSRYMLPVRYILRGHSYDPVAGRPTSPMGSFRKGCFGGAFEH